MAGMAAVTHSGYATTETLTGTTADTVAVSRPSTFYDALEITNHDSSTLLWVHPATVTASSATAAGDDCIPIAAGGQLLVPYTGTVAVVGDGNQYTVAVARADWT